MGVSGITMHKDLACQMYSAISKSPMDSGNFHIYKITLELTTQNKSEQIPKVTISVNETITVTITG